MGKRCGSAGVISLLCIISIGLTLPANANKVVNQRVLRIFDVTTAHGIVDKKADRPTSVFAPDDNPIYVWFVPKAARSARPSRRSGITSTPTLRFTSAKDR